MRGIEHSPESQPLAASGGSHAKKARELARAVGVQGSWERRAIHKGGRFDGFTLQMRRSCVSDTTVWQLAVLPSARGATTREEFPALLECVQPR
jgi:hypothetical protein